MSRNFYSTIMKIKSILLFLIVFSMSLIAQTVPCGTVINDTFDGDGAIPIEWTEYNTTGRVTVADGHMKFDHNTSQPSVYRTFSPVNDQILFSFDVEASRNTATCLVDLLSSEGEYIASVDVGGGSAYVNYATSMSGDTIPTGYIDGVVEGRFQKDTQYSLSLLVDFASQTVNYYSYGQLMLENIPFLQTASDAAKIDIQLLYMWGDNGTYFFDNVNIIQDDVNRISLSAAISSITETLDNVSVGDTYGKYSQASYDLIQKELDAAIVVFEDCATTQENIDAALEELLAAQIVFESAKIDEAVLKLYSEYDFSGDEHELKCGYYNGDLGVFDNKTVSFKLDKGYMLCVAQDINGAGVSKIYVASETDLAINLPSELQKSISFIRVGPWRDVKKKGASGKSSTNDVALALKASWFYDWGNDDANIGDCEYVYMNWAGGTNAAKMRTFGENMNATHHLAFNEPDGDKQANMTVDKAIEQYAILQASGLRLGAPAVTDGAKGRAWLDEFMSKAIAAGYRIDFIPVHYYKIMGVTAFKAWLKDFYDTYQVPIWVTEFNYGDIWASNEKDKTEAEVLTNMTAYCEMMDEADFVERYCVFTWQPSDYGNHSLMSVRNPVTLNSVGEYYANHESPVAYTQEVYEQGPNAIGDITAALDINIYPTVVEDGELFIKLADNNYVGVSLRIVDITGRLVLSQDLVNERVDVKHLPKGMYIVNILSVNGRSAQKIYVQ